MTKMLAIAAGTSPSWPRTPHNQMTQMHQNKHGGMEVGAGRTNGHSKAVGRSASSPGQCY